MVEIPYPVERVIVLNTGTVSIMRALGVADRIVGISGTVAENPAFWGELSKLPQVAMAAHAEINYEAVIALNPQIVLTWGTHPAVDLEKIVAALAPAGIAVVGIDSFRFATMFQDIGKLGTIFGQGERADQLVAFYQDILNLIEERIAGLPQGERVRAYAEHHTGKFRSFGPGSDWNLLIEMAGGVNIFADAGRPFITVDLETVLARNPQVILEDSRRAPLGHGVTDRAPAGDFLAVFIDRPGWEKLDAVRDGRVYVVSPAIGTGPDKFIGALYFARIFHPELFADIDPDEVLQDYYERFHGQRFPGTFVYPEL
ncbi:MAG: Vitamin B12-binding protein [Dehalococcoidia bacterium]|nr:Vitamin B12-binding protein [Bacillota bacterium]